MKRIALACCLLFNSMLASAQEAPPSPYESAGVCPFECCTYREWTADADIPVHEQRSEQSPVLFRLHREDPVDALTGIVVTERAPMIRIEHALQDGYVDGKDGPQLALVPGDVVYYLAPLGEGIFLFWYKGKVYKAGSPELQASPTVDGKEMTLTWWKQVRNKAGQTGWTRDDRFKHMDACG